ncbi:MAG: methyltransferase domain-containing protein [Myxococcaceae bacterium]
MSAFAHDSERLAQTYDRVSDLQLEEGQRLVERLGLQPGARVLDVGCGTGRLTHWIAARIAGGEVIGIDPLVDRIELARSHGGGARFEAGQAEDLSAFADASFDAVCMSSVLHWVGDKAKALAEARRVLRPGGLLGVTTQPSELSRAGTLGSVFETVFSRAHVDRSSLTFARAFTTTELISLVAASRLDFTELQITPRVRRFASAEAVLDFIEASAFGTFLRPVSDELRRSLRDGLLAAFEALREPDGIFLRGWGTLFVAQPSSRAALSARGR